MSDIRNVFYIQVYLESEGVGFGYLKSFPAL